MKNTDEKVQILIDGASGIYLPQRFVNEFELTQWGITLTEEDRTSIIDGPESEWYWEIWETVLDSAEYKDKAGHKWTLSQDVDLFAVRDDMTEDEYSEIFG